MLILFPISSFFPIRRFLFSSPVPQFLLTWRLVPSSCSSLSAWQVLTLFLVCFHVPRRVPGPSHDDACPPPVSVMTPLRVQKECE